MGKFKPWVIGFIGSGDVTYDNATELLDVWLPEDVAFRFVIPKRIPRTSKGLKIIAGDVAGDFEATLSKHEEYDEILKELLDSIDQGTETFLVVLDVDDATALIAEKALDNRIPVKDLCHALEDVQFTEPEVPTRSRRGKPRGETVQAEVEGPATIINQEDWTEAMETAFRLLIKKVVTEMFPGAHAFTDLHEQDEKVRDGEPTVRAFVNEDGEYRLAPKRSRKKAGEEEVQIPESKARELDLLDD